MRYVLYLEWKCSSAIVVEFVAGMHMVIKTSLVWDHFRKGSISKTVLDSGLMLKIK